MAFTTAADSMRVPSDGKVWAMTTSIRSGPRNGDDGAYWGTPPTRDGQPRRARSWWRLRLRQARYHSGALTVGVVMVLPALLIVVAALT